MLRTGINKFHITRKPVALKPLPQFEENQRSPADWDFGKTDTGYSSVYNADNDAQELLEQQSPPAKSEKSFRSKLPPREFPTDRKSKWRRYSFHIVLMFALFLTIFTPIYLTRRIIYPLTRSAGNLPFFDCTYNDKFSFEGIDAPFGVMRWSSAKWIDIAFNALLGRGLQTLIAWICYSLFNAVLMNITESHRITYRLYSSLALAPTRLDGLKPTVKAFFSKLPRFVKFQLFWLLLTTLYLAMFPTLIDSVSGYQAIQSTMLILPNNTRLDTPLVGRSYEYFGSDPSLSIYKYVPPNGTMENIEFAFSFPGSYRVDYTGSALPTVYGCSMNYSINPFERDPNLFEGEGDGIAHEVTLNSTKDVYISRCFNSTTSAVYSMRWVTNEYTSHCPDWENYGTPHLFYEDDSCDNWYYFQGPIQANPWLDASDPSQYKNRSYTPPFACTPAWNTSYFYNSSNYECVAGSKLKYQWGFSYEFLLVVSCVNAFWLLGTYAIYLQASTNSQLTAKGRKFGTWRGVIDLAEALREDLGSETCAYGDDDIEKEVKKMEKRGQGVKYHVTDFKEFGDEESGSGQNPRLRLTSKAGDGKIFVERGMVYG